MKTGEPVKLCEIELAFYFTVQAHRSSNKLK